MPHLIRNFLRPGDCLRNLLPQQFPVALTQSVDGDPGGPFVTEHVRFTESSFAVGSVQVNASDTEQWVYVDLDRRTEVTPADPLDDQVWDIAFRRFHMALNGGVSGTGGVTAAAALELLERTRASLLAAMDQAEGKDLSNVSRQHPALGPLDGYQWIGSLAGHEMRHTLQIEEIRKALVDA